MQATAPSELAHRGRDIASRRNSITHVKVRAAFLGLVAALVGVLGIHLSFSAYSRLVLALFLSLTACVYLGALLAQAQSSSTWAAELAVAAVVFGCSLLGISASPVWLAFGYGIHGGWDWLHETRTVQTRVAGWFPPLCATFDLVVGAFILGWVR